MFSINYKFDEDFSIGTFYSNDDILIHNWTNFLNASKYCRDNNLIFDIDNWIKTEPVVIETYKWIKEKFNIKPTFLSPHGFEITQGLYMHPILFQIFIVDIRGINIYKPNKSDELLDFTNELIDDTQLLHKKYLNSIKRKNKNN
jgi:hypothetical protein